MARRVESGTEKWSGNKNTVFGADNADKAIVHLSHKWVIVTARSGRCKATKWL